MQDNFYYLVFVRSFHFHINKREKFAVLWYGWHTLGEKEYNKTTANFYSPFKVELTKKKVENWFVSNCMQANGTFATSL